MPRLFGTDGIRGRALEPPLDETTVRRLGVALAAHLRSRQDPPRLLLAGDTRSSTEVLATWLGEAFQASGGHLTWGGVLPTPAVSHLLRADGFVAGVVISASHNPAGDNGIKVLGPGGEKLEEAGEEALEALLERVSPVAGPPLPPRDASLVERYLDLLAAAHQSDRPLAGRRVVVDAANGAGSAVAAPLLERLGARTELIFAEPDGRNINLGCGATAPQALQDEVRRRGADAGLALDGDADRAVMVDERGELQDGDDVLLAWARHLLEQDRLPGRLVVATVMSNFGLERTLAAEGIALERCPVGDRNVWLAMRGAGAALGGEQSGHVICSHYAVTGDGLLTGSKVLAIAAHRGAALSHLSGLQRMPQVLLNVEVARKPDFDEVPEVLEHSERVERELAGRGRLLLRYSGTEPLARVMLEGEDADEIGRLAEELAATVRRVLG